MEKEKNGKQMRNLIGSFKKDLTKAGFVGYDEKDQPKDGKTKFEQEQEEYRKGWLRGEQGNGQKKQI